MASKSYPCQSTPHATHTNTRTHEHTNPPTPWGQQVCEFQLVKMSDCMGLWEPPGRLQAPPVAQFRQPPMGPLMAPLGPQGCASWARNPKGPKIAPFWHQLGCHPTVLHDIKTRLRSIPAQISPDRSNPLNLNFFSFFFFTIVEPKMSKIWIWGREKRPCEE